MQKNDLNITEVTTGFSNRIRKNFKQASGWAKKQNTNCFRIYDWDIPEIPLAIDYYDGRIHIAEYARKKETDHPAQDSFIRELTTTAAAALNIPEKRIHLKLRKQQKGKEQYNKLARTGREHIVLENGLSFRINPWDYLDTGLFLDHRPTRLLFQKDAVGKRVLNLFAYTGSFSVYAAAGGSGEITTVDMSNTYIEWAVRNFKENMLDPNKHRFIRADVLAFLKDEKEQVPYDLVMLDPPTFSNSKKMEGVFDVQRDYPGLIADTLAVMNPNGILYFSTNARKFKLAEEEIHASRIINITNQTIPADFRNKKIHQCWKIIK